MKRDLQTQLLWRSTTAGVYSRFGTIARVDLAKPEANHPQRWPGS